MQSKIDFKDLPVYKHKDLILKTLEENQVIVVESPTGSGKTTQLPLILKEAGYDEGGIIGVTQPRRIATLSICDFIKRQLGIQDSYCAYTMRFDDTSDENTRIKIMTDGILLQELKSDHYLSRYSVMMVDEAHERSLNIDFILGLLKQVVEVRKDIRIIISSATINTKKFSDFFDGAKIISIDAKTYPVELIYAPLDEPDVTLSHSRRQSDETDRRLSKIYSIVEKIVTKKTDETDGGDVLIFLPGEAEIICCEDMLKHSHYSSALQIYPLYGRLSKEEQEKVFTPTQKGKTKVVIATNIAETSITIDGISYVIDSGLCKMNFYDQKNFTSSLVSRPISKASAMQRLGRAGRTRPGVCYRLYTEESFGQRDEFTMEEITRSDLAEVALRMSDLAIYDYDNFPFITAPKKGALASAEYTLKLIGAIDEEHHLTSIGEMMVIFPLLPRLSRAIVESIMTRPDVLSEVLIAAAFLSTKGPLLYPSDKAILARSRQERFQDAAFGDFAGYLKLYNAYSEIDYKDEKAKKKFCDYYFLDFQTMNEIVHIKRQLEELVSSLGVPITGGGSMADYLICLGSGLLQFVCSQEGGKGSTYHSVTANQIYIHPSCSWFASRPQYILAGELVQTSRLFARSVSPLKSEWLKEINPRLTELLKGQHETKKGKQTAKAIENKSGSTAKSDVYIFEGFHFKKLEMAKNEGKKKKGKNKSQEAVYKIPIGKLQNVAKAAFAHGSVPRIQVCLVTEDGIPTQPMNFKTAVQDARLLKGKKTIHKFESNIVFRLEDDHQVMADHIGSLFSPVKVKGGFASFLALQNMKKAGCFRLALYPSLTAAVDETFYALSRLMEETENNKSRYAKLRKAVQALLRELDEAEGLEIQ